MMLKESYVYGLKNKLRPLNHIQKLTQNVRTKTINLE
jgi:hypothetical protein